ncbi:hypothetical protein [Marinifilum caeruleilacunae]|uniref:Lipoprotein n=1 Tax=Marinifilum caeruleilacunae TaxID=2499076 RepID=A0ABX1X110_9BACT|nr:hypothetical protein [Marinifilum caeruleilacunae]NOU62062.1 hypothetical protein [Marinifilum caeruleilacunae]
MKRNIVAVGMLLAFSAALWSCSSSDDKTPEQDQTLEQNLTTETQSLAAAVDEITSSEGYGLITMSESTKEGDGEETDERFSYDHSITLEDIKGVYDYILPVTEEATETKGWYWNSAFERVDDSDFFEINLPQEKATRPWKLYVEEDGDEELDNDFNVTASQYNMSTVMSNEGYEFDYLLDADITIEEVEAGEIFVDWNMSMSTEMSFEYVSEFGFANGYSVGHEYMFGESFDFAYNLKKDDEVLFMEEVEYTPGNEETDAEYEYALTIGNIKIVKNSSSDEYMVYRDDILEEGAIITLIEDDTKEGDDEGNEDESDNAFCRGGFDIKITFTDGTEVILSELIGEETLEQLDEIFSSMHDMYFVNKLVDKVAREAYQMNMQQDAGE